MEELMMNAIQSRVKAVLTTPEYCVKLSKLQFLEKFHLNVGIDLIVAKEAHCDVIWNSFRSDMTLSKKVFESIPNAARVAITASPIGGNTKVTAELGCLKSNYFVSKFGLYRADLKIEVFTEKISMTALESLLEKHKKIIIVRESGF